MQLELSLPHVLEVRQPRGRPQLEGGLCVFLCRTTTDKRPATRAGIRRPIRQKITFASDTASRERFMIWTRCRDVDRRPLQTRCDGTDVAPCSFGAHELSGRHLQVSRREGGRLVTRSSTCPRLAETCLRSPLQKSEMTCTRIRATAPRYTSWVEPCSPVQWRFSSERCTKLEMR